MPGVENIYAPYTRELFYNVRPLRPLVDLHRLLVPQRHDHVSGANNEPSNAMSQQRPVCVVLSLISRKSG